MAQKQLLMLMILSSPRHARASLLRNPSIVAQRDLDLLREKVLTDQVSVLSIALIEFLLSFSN